MFYQFNSRLDGLLGLDLESSRNFFTTNQAAKPKVMHTKDCYLSAGLAAGPPPLISTTEWHVAPTCGAQGTGLTGCYSPMTCTSDPELGLD